MTDKKENKFFVLLVVANVVKLDTSQTYSSKMLSIVTKQCSYID